MKMYVIDELRYQDYEKIESFLDDTFEKSGMVGIYWLPIEPDMLTAVQQRTPHVSRITLPWILSRTACHVNCWYGPATAFAATASAMQTNASVIGL